MPCKNIITESEVLRAHKIVSKNITGSLCKKPDCDEYRRYDVIDLKDVKNESVLDREIAFECLKEDRLWGRSGRGKIAKLHNIRIKVDKKSTGLGKELHTQQLTVLRAQNFDEMQLSAKWDGVIVWPSLFFKFKNEYDEEELLDHISTYMFDVLRYNNEKISRIMRQYKSIKEIATHLKPEDKIWFTEWYKGTDKSLQYSMYKEVS